MNRKAWGRVISIPLHEQFSNPGFVAVAGVDGAEGAFLVEEEDGGEGVDAVGADEGALPGLAIAGGGPLGNAEAFHDLADGGGVLVERNGGDGEFDGGEFGEGSAEILDPKQAG